MGGGIRYLLFDKPVMRKDGRDKPLFRFQSDLAKAIVRLSSTYNKADSIRPYLNQVLKYDGKIGKPMSADLKEAIVLASKDVLDPQSALFHNFEIELEKAYHSMISPAKNYSSDKVEFQFLSRWQEFANRAVIFNRQPLEVKYLEWSTDRQKSWDAEILIQKLVENVTKNYLVENNGNSKLITLFDIFQHNPSAKIKVSQVDRNLHYSYRYYVSSFNVAKKIYEGLFNFIYAEIDIERDLGNVKNAHNTIFKILELFTGGKHLIDDEEKSILDLSFIKVFCTEGFLMSVPTAYFESTEGIIDPRDGLKNHEILFSLIVEKDNLLSVSTIENSDLEFWKEEVYYPLIWAKKQKFSVDSISFSRIIQHLKRTIKKNNNEF